MGFDLEITIPALTVLLQGIFSFFSPCILPIIPLYVGYLAGGSMTVDEEGHRRYNQKTVRTNTLFFIVGVSFAFFLLGLGFSALGQFFTQHQMMFSRIGGILVILLGLVQIGFLEKPFGGREFKLPIKLNVLRMNPLTALLMGFTFSFAWTPCVGPALSTVLIMISSANTSSLGLLLMGVYTLGFVLPFLLVGIFTTKCLDLFQRHKNVVTYTVKIGAVLMILMGLMMVTGTMNGVTGYLSSIGTNVTAVPETTEQAPPEATPSEEVADENVLYPAPDFTLTDQYGNSHTLSDYQGQVVFLNFWATWCGPCQMEMPDIEALYNNYGLNEEDVVILGVALPCDDNSSSQDGTIAEITQFLESGGYTYPTAMDTSGAVLSAYGISAFPTTFMVDVEGNLYGYVAGMLSYDIMETIVQQTIDNIPNE